MDQNIVLRLRVPIAPARSLARLPLVRDQLAARPRSRRSTAVYYDTPDEALRVDGFVLWLRGSGRRRTQIVAGEAFNAANILPDGEGPDLARIRDTALRDRMAKLAAGAPLQPVFRAEIRRRIYPLTIGGAPVEMTIILDRLSASGVTESSAEIQLRAQDRAAAFVLAEQIAGEIPVALERGGLVGRGYDLAHARRPQPALAGDVTLDGEWTAWRGFVAIMRSCLDQLLANDIALAAAGGSEAIHQLRVAVRRMRAALSAFAATLPAEPAASFKTDLQWLQQALGPARDWGVFCNETLAALRTALPDRAGLAELVSAAESLRGQALAEARKALSSIRYGLFLIRLECWLGDQAAAGDPLLAGFATRALAKRDRKLRRAGKGLDGSTPERLHQLRIAAKKARYAAEFFRDLFGRKATRKYVRALRRIQDDLGVMNDADVALRLVNVARPGDPQIGAVLDGWFAARIAVSRSDVNALWEKFERVPRYWVD